MNGTEAITIVLDTNIFQADYRMTGTAFRIFLSGASRTGASVYIPAVVFDEIRANYMGDVGRLISRLRANAQDWQRLTGKALYEIPEKANAPSEAVAYDAYLRDRLQEVSAILQPYPEVSHADRVQRILRGRLPSRNKDRGYRDALIWETVLFLCQRGVTKLYLVTNNKHDFGEGPQPHLDLLADIKRVGVSSDVVSIIPSLMELNKQFIEPRLEQLDEMVDRFSKDEVPKFSLREWAYYHLVDALNEEDWGSSILDVDPLHIDVSIKWPATVNISSIDDVRLLPSGDLVVSATAAVESIIEVEVDPEARYRYHDVHELLEYEMEARGGTQSCNFKGRVMFSLILAGDSYRVLSADVNGVSTGRRSVSTHPHPHRPIRPPPSS